MQQIINSLIDSDLYKFTMQQAVLELFPSAKVEYRFKNRGDQRFTPDFVEELKRQILLMSTISLSDTEYSWIKENIPFFKPSYLEYLKNYRFNPNEVEINLTNDNDLEISIKGSWHSTILWEVPLMALISELYFIMIDTNWRYSDGTAKFGWRYSDGTAKFGEKSRILGETNCIVADFGTRRRRSCIIQDSIIYFFKDEKEKGVFSGFIGTSNLYFAMKYNLKPIGTMAHEWVMGMSVLEGLRNSNYYALQNWVRVYNADLGIALTDTYGTPAFFRNFNVRLAKLYDGVRHDSGDAYKFTDAVVAHYKSLGIDPLSKTIVFSDGLNVQSVIAIKIYCENKIKASFGIGTHLTNDFEGSPALNMVIKLWSCEGVHVVKLGDGTGKTMGDVDAVRVAQWMFQDKPLDVSGYGD